MTAIIWPFLIGCACGAAIVACFVGWRVLTYPASLRDWFAGQAFPAVSEAYFTQNKCGCAADHALRNIPRLAYKYADAMLKARQEPGR